MAVRKIIHIDMDAFYASIEQRDFPKYRGKPLIVGGKSQRSVVSAASYEARKFGIHSAMASKIARQKCPDLIVAQPRFGVYRAVSKQIMEIFMEYTDWVEPLSLDEAFLDVTENKINLPSATLIARRIKKHVRKETGLTASAGVSFNKFLAKIASDYNKPDGLFVIEPKDAQQFIDRLPIEKFFGIGAATARKMHKIGVENGYDLRQWKENQLVKLFGKNGHFFYNIVRCNDTRRVNPNRIQKSIGAERTFEQDLAYRHQMKTELNKIADKLVQRITRLKRYGTTLTLKIKFADFTQITRSKTSTYSLKDKDRILEMAFQLLDAEGFDGKKVRLLGLSISNLDQPNQKKWVQLKIEFNTKLHSKVQSKI